MSLKRFFDITDNSDIYFKKISWKKGDREYKIVVLNDNQNSINDDYSISNIRLASVICLLASDEVFDFLETNNIWEVKVKEWDNELKLLFKITFL